VPGAAVSLLGLVLMTVGLLPALLYIFGGMVTDFGVDMMEEK